VFLHGCSDRPGSSGAWSAQAKIDAAESPRSCRHFPVFEHQRPVEQGAVVAKRVEFAALTARIDRSGQVGQETGIEFAPAVPAIQLFEVDGGYQCPMTGRDERVGQFAGRCVPERKDGVPADSIQRCFAPCAQFGEEKIDERDVVQSRYSCACLVECRSQSGLVGDVRRGTLDGHLDQREAKRIDLLAQEIAAHVVHGHAVARSIQRGQQASCRPFRIGRRPIQCHQGILSAAPGEQERGRHGPIRRRARRACDRSRSDASCAGGCASA